jgi:hypothetical protein
MVVGIVRHLRLAGLPVTDYDKFDKMMEEMHTILFGID